MPLARLPQPPESPIFERNVQSGVNETSKKEVTITLTLTLSLMGEGN